MTDAVRVLAHAKINLFLRILARESSGFHQIETAFALLELADELVVRRTAAGVTLEVDGPDLGPSEENLAVRAARMVLEATGNRFGVHIKLTKRIPVRAGLGGGSSDGAAALHAVNTVGGNDFETVVFGKRPELRSLFERVAETGPVWVRLCGSGSAIAAVYKKETERENAVQRLGEKNQAVIRTSTRQSPAPAPSFDEAFTPR